jgi:hypothetical protein
MKIFVAIHKPGSVLVDKYTPIHVGRACSPYNIEMSDMIGDDTGDNISIKNPSYCEMTAHYWVWKNVRDTEYVGFCHYRRFWGIDVTDENIDNLMQNVDVILVEPSYYVDSVYSYFAKFVGAENMTILSLVIKKRCPDYFGTLEKVCDGVKFHPFNMLICRKSLFDQYCEWIFSILEECEKYIKPAPYTNAQRALAYIAEMLTGVYFIHRQMRIMSVPYYKIDDGHKILVKRSEEEKRSLAIFESLLQNELADKVKQDRKEKFDNPAILLGLKKDGILDRIIDIKYEGNL